MGMQPKGLRRPNKPSHLCYRLAKNDPRPRLPYRLATELCGAGHVPTWLAAARLRDSQLILHSQASSAEGNVSSTSWPISLLDLRPGQAKSVAVERIFLKL